MVALDHVTCIERFAEILFQVRWIRCARESRIWSIYLISRVCMAQLPLFQLFS